MSSFEDMEPSNRYEEKHAASGWDIFLSHSGAQKGFAKDLFEILNLPYKVFFDIDHLSLPLAEDFPPRIFQATQTCKLALVILSNEFFCSKWTMIELSAFVKAMPSSGVKILPLFYELFPEDLKDNAKLEVWHDKWEGFASKDGRIEMSLWKNAFQKLRSINGLKFDKADGQLAYLREIESAVYGIIPPCVKFSHAGIQGKDRLCKVLIDKFEELEQRPHRISADGSDVCLLGVYGLPGSGKTTLSQCLCDHFSPTFAGRVLHLELESDPTPTQLLSSAKKLLQKLDNFHKLREMLMSTVTDISQVHSILKDSNLQRMRVFLAIDNITSQDSVEFVQAILQLGVGMGSRVMLVARTLDILCPLLNPLKCYHGHVHYVYDSMRVPSLNEKEASCVLMQHVSGIGLDLDCGREMQERYRPSHREIIIKLARLCSFGYQSPLYTKTDTLYLPLVLKLIGFQLRRDGMHLEKWERQSLQFERMVEFKEDAVRRIVEGSFEKLHPEKLKLIFLDVALFMVPYSWSCKIKSETAWELLSFMHKRSLETIKREIRELIRCGFLDFSDGYICVHDVFLEFAKSVLGVSSMYCRWSNNASAQEFMDLRSAHKSSVDLRVVILEVDEECKSFEFPAGLSTVRVVVVRNCKSLAALGLAGLTSLVCLQIEECPSLRIVEYDCAHEHTLKSVKWVNKSACKGISNQQLQESLVQSRQRMWCGVLAFSGWPQRPLNGLMSVTSQVKALQVLRLQGTGITSLGDLSSYWPQLRVLEVLEDCLEELELGNLPSLQQFFLGHASREAFLCDGFWPSRYRRRNVQSEVLFKNLNLLAGCPGLEDVRICLPSWEDSMGSLVFPSPNLRILWLKGIHSGQPVSLDLTSSARSLEEIHVHDHCFLRSIESTCQLLNLVNITVDSCPNLVKITGIECLPRLRKLHIEQCLKLQALENLRDVSMLEELYLRKCPALTLTLQGVSNLESLEEIHVYDHWFLRSIESTCQLLNLVNIEVWSCPNLVKITGIECLPRLRELCIVGCLKLQALENLRDVSMLEYPALILTLQGVSNLESLAKLCVKECPKVQNFWSDVENLTALRELCGGVYGTMLKLNKLVNLRKLSFDWEECEEQDVGNQLSVCCSTDGEATCEQENDNAQLQSMQNTPLLLSAPAHLSYLTFKGVQHLVCLDGINCLLRLHTLSLEDLPRLASLQGLQSLTHLQHLSIQNCLAVKELSPLCTLVNLERLFIKNCMAVRELPSLCTLVKLSYLSLEKCANVRSVELSDKLELLSSVSFDGCENLEHFHFGAEDWLQHGSLTFTGCKFASIEALVGWVLDAKVSKAVFEASWDALWWEFSCRHHEKPRERKRVELEQGLETLCACLTKKLHVLTLDTCFDFQPLVRGFEEAWGPEHLRGMRRLMEGLSRVSVREVLEQCQSDTQFRTSVVNCLLETDPDLLRGFMPVRDFLSMKLEAWLEQCQCGAQCYASVPKSLSLCT